MITTKQTNKQYTLNYKQHRQSPLCSKTISNAKSLLSVDKSKYSVKHALISQEVIRQDHTYSVK